MYMPVEKRLFLFIISSLMVFTLGCAKPATKPVEPPPPQLSLDALMQRASSELDSKQPEKALATLAEASKNNPTSKEPWLKSAQIHFESGAYGKAILAGEEAAQRDPNDKQAQSILTVSGLRVATHALSELRKDSPLTGSVRSEAEVLTRSLRESIGEIILVPPASTSAQSGQPEVVPEAARKPVVAKPKRPAVKPAVTDSTSKPPANSTSGSGNPFEVLK